MKDITSVYINDILQEVIQFNEKFKESTILEKDKFQIRVDEVDIEELTKEYESNQALLDVLTEYDNETLITHLDGFKEASESKIANYESTITSAITQDWVHTKTQIEESQHARSRDIIQEIVENTKRFSEENRKQWMNLTFSYRP